MGGDSVDRIPLALGVGRSILGVVLPMVGREGKMKLLIATLSVFFSNYAYAQTCPTPTQLDTDLTAAAQSDVISLAGVSVLSCPETSMTETWGGGKLLFSDSPESPTATGKLFSDDGLSATSGTAYNRILAYHVNSSGSTKRFTVVLKNTSGSSGSLVIQKKGTAGPTTSFLYAGKLVFERWLNSTAGTTVSVPAGSWVRIDSTWDTTNVATGNLLTGMWDYSFNQTHEVAVCITTTTANPITYCPTATVLTKDMSHQRGTMQYNEKTYDSASGVTIDTADGIQQFPLAGGTLNDTNVTGTDDTDGSSVTLSGNYGILYRIHLSTSNSDGQNLGFGINPRAGSWGGACWADPTGLLAGGKFLLPAGSGSTSDNTKMTVEGRYNPSSTSNPWVQWMPTSGSAFPVRFVIVPH